MLALRYDSISHLRCQKTTLIIKECLFIIINNAGKEAMERARRQDSTLVIRGTQNPQMEHNRPENGLRISYVRPQWKTMSRKVHPPITQVPKCPVTIISPSVMDRGRVDADVPTA